MPTSSNTPRIALSPTKAPRTIQKGQRRRSDQIRQKTPIQKSPEQFSASKTCQALIQSPCRSENFDRQRRRLYEDVKRKLGQGGFGSVYTGKYDGNQVAIKQLHNHMKAGQVGESLFAEMNAFQLRHPNIVKILTVECIGPFRIVFEYVGRRNLQQILDGDEESGANSIERLKRVQFCQQTAAALDFCHSNRVLHLDVKPANILITDDWQRCKLADFGCSRSIALPTKKQADGEASIPGTLIYKAPELLRGAAPSPKADVYSFGVVLWQCATRQIPFDGMNPHTIVYNVVRRNLRPSVKNEDGVKFDDEEVLLIDLAEKCWPASPDDRINLTQVQETLQKFYAANVV